MTQWDEWIGRSEIRHDVATEALITRFRATIDSDETYPIAPQGIHWCLCVPDAPSAQLDGDGHPKRGEFFPPIPQPRRMWASSTVQFHAAIMANMAIMRTSTIARIEEKQGKSGDLVFVSIDHEWTNNGIALVTEQQNLVYRAASNERQSRPVTTQFEAQAADWHRSITPSEALLFRFSALTFNSHRIHYDAPYAEQEEGYPGLVVHGPLMAALLLDHAARKFGPNALQSFEFRGLAPAFVGDPLHLTGQQTSAAIALNVIGNDGRAVMTAQGLL
jgi:3-methylfumaryl-CoA hydratase